MKTIFKALFIAIVVVSCSSEIKKDTVNQETNQQANYDAGESSKLVSQTKEEGGFFNNLIGKNTVDIERMGWYNCAGEILDSPDGAMTYAVSHISKSQNKCRNGKGKVILEKFLYRNKDRIVYEIIDEINIETDYPENAYSWTTCKVDGKKSQEYFLIQFKDQRQAELTEIRNLWTLDLQLGKFTKVKNPEDVTCINPDYSDGL